MNLENKNIELPPPKPKGVFSLEETILKRRSHRAYAKNPLTIGEISQLLFAGQGIIGSGRRTVPSAGAFYPIEIYLSVSRIRKISAGLYKYLPEIHSLKKISDENLSKKLTEAAFFQPWVGEASVILIICGNFKKTVEKYKEKGKIFVIMEVGHTAQNISLQATALKLGTLCVGGFDEKEIKRLLSLDDEIKPLYLMPVGRIFKNYQQKETKILNKFYNFLKTSNDF